MKYLGETAARGQGTKPPRTVPRYKPSSFSPRRVHHSKRNLYQCPNKFISCPLSPATLHCNKIQNRLHNRSTCSKIPWCREPQQRGKCSDQICTGLYINICVGKMQKLHASSPPLKPKQCRSGSLQLLGFTSSIASLSSRHESYIGHRLTVNKNEIL